MRARIVGAFLVAALVWWADGAAVDARCQVAQLGPRMLTPITATLPRDGGGVVVGLVNGTTGGAMPSGVQLTRGRRSQELVAQELAPGLVRFAPAARLLPGAWTAPALGATTSLTIGRGPMPGVPTRPSVSELRRVARTEGGSRPRTRAEVRATLEFPVPSGIVAIVTAWGENGQPAAWQPAVEGQREAVVWGEPGRCQQDIPGTVAPPEEGAVGRIAFVDAFGQVSPFSASVPVR